MARLTGNHRRGNERQARNHPRNTTIEGSPESPSAPKGTGVVWDENAWEDYLWWHRQDRKVLKRINLLLTDITRNVKEGIGKPEALKHDFAGYWSRRITDEHRLVHKIDGDQLRIAACRYHYG